MNPVFLFDFEGTRPSGSSSVLCGRILPNSVFGVGPAFVLHACRRLVGRNASVDFGMHILAFLSH